MITEEEKDRIRVRLYNEFSENYFKNRKEKSPLQLSSEESPKFYREQKTYVDEEYQKIKYNLNDKTTDKKIDTSKTTTKKQVKSMPNLIKISDYLNKKV